MPQTRWWICRPASVSRLPGPPRETLAPDQARIAPHEQEGHEKRQQDEERGPAPERGGAAEVEGQATGHGCDLFWARYGRDHARGATRRPADGIAGSADGRASGEARRSSPPSLRFSASIE
jgi:hypothetical protein